MNAAELISRKRDGGELSDAEIRWFIDEFTNDRLPDCQMAALAMAVFLRGMTTAETAALTSAMLESGIVLRWPAGGAPKVDKHSTGGIGDKVSLVLAPWLACCGVAVPMISGRGLGPTGGTLDKLEAIAGFRTDLSTSEIYELVQRVGCVITGASREIAPADRKLYALRDVTGTVPSIPLITASIMSKKLAEGLNALVLDVKYGSGAFMKTEARARELAASLVATGTHMGVATEAVLSDMNQPLGRKIGNALEVIEALEVLEGRGPGDVLELTRTLCMRALVLSRRVETAAAAERVLDQTLASGAARAKFQEMIEAQGGDLDKLVPPAPARDFTADRSGVLRTVDGEQIGYAVIELGGGRKQPADRIDHAVGLEMRVRIGDSVKAGDVLLSIHAEDDNPGLPAAQQRLRSALSIE